MEERRRKEVGEERGKKKGRATYKGRKGDRLMTWKGKI